MKSSSQNHYFIAAFFNEEALHEIKQRLTFLQKNIPTKIVRWQSLEKLHLTLFFLGELSEPQCAPIQQELKKICQNQKKIELTLSHVEPFPLHQSHLLAIRPYPNATLDNLAQKIASPTLLNKSSSSIILDWYKVSGSVMDQSIK